MANEPLAKEIVGAAYKIHTTLGPGLLESVYEQALAFELTQKGIPHKRQHPIAITYETLTIPNAFLADLEVNEDILVEIKAVESLHPIHKRQLLTYLKLTNRPLGILINFGAYLIKDGIHRVRNGFDF